MYTPKGFKTMFTVSDIKQYFYCPRIIYFIYVVPVKPVVSTTAKMEMGKERHERISNLEKRRTLKAFGLSSGQREFRLSLYSEQLGLSGILDMAIFQKRRVFPVEFKNSFQKPWLNHTCQLAAYALLLEDLRSLPADEGFVYLIPQKKAERIPLKRAKSRIRNVLLELDAMVRDQFIPEPTHKRGRCVDCELLRYCPDVDF